MSQYTLFFSWQNDRKDTRLVINAALREAKATLEADGIELVVDQDTRNRTGKRNIDAEVLDKIRRCDIFLADLTPVVTYNTPALDAITNSLNAIQALSNKIQEPMAKIMVARPAGKTTNLSMAPVRLIFFNRGTEALDNLEISVLAVDRQVTFDDTNEKYGIPLIQPKSINATSASEFGIFQNIATLNPQSLYRFDEAFVHAPHDIGSFYLQWSLSSRTFPAEGSLLVHVEPDYAPDMVVNNDLAGTEQVVDLIKEE